MKKIYTLIFAIMAILASNAQSLGLAYGYDAAGNRVSRIVVGEPPLPSPRLNAPPSHQPDNVTVSPTVTTGTVNIATTADPAQSSMSWILTDAQGHTISHGEIKSQITPIVIGGVSGIYIINITTADGTAAFRVIKL